VSVLAIVGTRYFQYSRSLLYAKLIIRQEVTSGEWESIVTGDAAGIDQLTDQICAETGVPCKSYIPESRQWEPRGYKARNMLVAEAADAMLCIRDPNSLTYGSGWTANYFNSLGKRDAWIVEMH
jgi:hypothetical protein